MSSNMYLDVAAFQQKVLGIEPHRDPEPYRLLPNTPGYKTTMKGLEEELNELKGSVQVSHLSGQVDALIDLIYFALGGLYQMGVPVAECWDKVHAANMAKVKGTTHRLTQCDAVKPEGWEPPAFNLDRANELKPLDKGLPGNHLSDHAKDATLGVDVARKGFDRVAEIPAPLIEVACLLAKKAEDYRTGVPLSSYFPFGHESYTHMLMTKVLRLVSLCRGRAAGKKTNFESVRDTCLDVIAYATFYIQAIDAKEVK